MGKTGVLWGLMCKYCLALAALDGLVYETILIAKTDFHALFGDASLALNLKHRPHIRHVPGKQAISKTSSYLAGTSAKSIGYRRVEARAETCECFSV